MKGVLNIYKHSGMTSTAVISKARYILGTKAIGHMGTLDPQGTGVLLAGVGKATRLFDYFLGSDKEYVAEFEFGYTTDTLDPEGQVTASTCVLPTKSAILKALAPLCGVVDQMPPIYSAKSINGVRAYDLARQGKIVELKTARVEVKRLELLEQTGDNKYRFFIECSSGTYIRSICRDLSESLGSLACMTSIHRKRSGSFLDTTATTLEQLEKFKNNALISVESALDHLERRDFDDSLYNKILNGIKLDTPPSDKPFTVYCQNKLFGIGKSVDGKLKIPTFLLD